MPLISTSPSGKSASEEVDFLLEHAAFASVFWHNMMDVAIKSAFLSYLLGNCLKMSPQERLKDQRVRFGGIQW